jgi:predicted AlkP superfamily pyrophosphatase or phosphodiesterase
MMRLLLSRILVCSFLFVAGIAAFAVPLAEHVFIISIDGGKPSVIDESRMPVLKRLVAEGAYTWKASTIYPCLTLPSHTSMLTGVGPDKHHIIWNSYLPSFGVVRVPTVFAEAKQAGLSTAMFVGKKKFRHLLLPGSVDKFEFDETQTQQVTKSVDGSSKMETSDTVLAAIVAKEAASYIVEKKPNLCFIHFTDPDDVGHEEGWGSAAQKRAFEDVDAALSQIIEAIKSAGIIEQSVVIITADHGGLGKKHGFDRPDDMLIPWVAWGKGAKKNYEITAPVKTFDTAATALWLLGVSCPENFDGKPVSSAFVSEGQKPSSKATVAPSAGGVKKPG